ncbi:MAG: transposase [bacterium]|nr:transposase [bacterium]
MSRVARIVVPGFPHHVTQRGNRRADVFETDGDHDAYLRFMKQYADKRGLVIWAYCLMTNHVHLVAVPVREDSLGLALRDAHTVYAMYFNSRTQLSGHVWQGRFHSCPMDERHLWAAVRYVERNPVRAGMVERAEDYAWSSAAAHCGLRSDPLLSPDFPPPGVVDDWADWLHEEREEDDACERIRQHTHTGRPCGSPTFLDQLEQLLQRVVRPKKGGRPRKTENP